MMWNKDRTTEQFFCFMCKFNAGYEEITMIVNVLEPSESNS